MSANRGATPEADRLILEAATAPRDLDAAELALVLQHVARAGFDPDALERVGGRLAGVPWQGRVLKGGDRLPPAEVHYLRHVVAQDEWPEGTTLAEYLQSMRAAILDRASGVFVSRFGGNWQIAVICPSRDLRGPGGHEWVMVEYRVTTGLWVTGFQPAQGLAQATQDPQREAGRWLRRPT
jgi:hypothetical protein